MTTLLTMGAGTAQADSSNPENGSDGEENGTNDTGPCEVILVGTQEPYIDFHPECLPDLPIIG